MSEGLRGKDGDCGMQEVVVRTSVIALARLSSLFIVFVALGGSVLNYYAVGPE